ncbi:hypothetical protein D3C77_686340 [compost metagenome]
MESMNWMVSLLMLGFLLLGLGFNFRNTNSGVTLMALGILCTLSTIGYKLYLILH